MAIGLVISLSTGAATEYARADGVKRPAARSSVETTMPDPVFAGAGHASLIRIPPGSQLPQTRRAILGVGKSMLVEVPVDLQNVLVSNPEVLDAVVQTSRQVYLLGKGQGEANAFMVGPDGQKVLLLEVTVQRDLAGLSDVLTRLIPGSRIRAETVGDNVVLTGSVVSPIDANRAADIAGRFIKKKDGVVNMLAVDSKEQVLLKVTVAEMQRNAIRRLGVNIGARAKGGSVSFTAISETSFPVSGGETSSGGTVGLSIGSGADKLTMTMKSLEQAGLSRILAEPNLTAISGETAKFLAGGEFPVPVGQRDGVITVEWKSFGANVVFKPDVLSEGRISLKVSAEVSELSSDGALRIADFAIPSVRVRRAETTLEVPSGGTIAMAGLLSDETRQNVEGIPGLKNLPVLGALFRSTDYLRSETELVILVTPYIATHAPKEKFARPDQNFAPAHDLRFYFLGQFHRLYGRPGHTPMYEGEYGFIIDHPRHGGTKG